MNHTDLRIYSGVILEYNIYVNFLTSTNIFFK